MSKIKKIKFPAIHKGLTKHEDYYVLSDYIYICDSHAIIFNSEFTFIVNLKELLSLNREITATPDQPYEEVLDLLDYLDGKLISSNYWEELISAEKFELRREVGDDFIKITSKGISKDLHHVSPLLEDNNSLDVYSAELMKYATKAVLGTPVCNVPFNVLQKIQAMVGTFVKNDELVLELFGKNLQVRFTFNSNRHFFGIIHNEYDINEEMFLSLGLEELAKSLIK